MPISPENAKRYPRDWKAIRARILARANNMCEWCGVPNYVYRIVGTSEWSADEDAAYLMAAPTAKVTRIVLTIAHLNHVIEDCSDENLRALCQRDHLAHDLQHHMANARATRRNRKAIADLF